MLDKKIIINLVKDTILHSCMMLFIITVIISMYYHNDSISALIKHYTKDWYSAFAAFYIFIIIITFSFVTVWGDFYKRSNIKPPGMLGVTILFPIVFIQLISKSITNHTITLQEFVWTFCFCLLIYAVIALCRRAL